MVAMKIGLVCPYSLTHGGGVQETILALAAGLNRLGHSAVIISHRSLSNKKWQKKDGIFLGGAIDFYSPMQTMTQLSLSTKPSEIDEMLAQQAFDILNFHEPWQPFLSRQILTRSQSVNIGSFHAKVPNTLLAQTVIKTVSPYTRTIVNFLDEITAVSPVAADYVSSLTDKPVSFVPNGIDLKRYHAPRHPGDIAGGGTKTILYVGRLERRKGLKYLLEAYKIISQTRDDVRLLIAGEGPDRAMLEKRVKQLDLPRVEFLGYISEAKKISLMRLAHLFVTPALYGESFGIVLLEAMASGLPIVAGDNPGYSQLLKNTGAMSLVNVRDPNEFARRIELFLSESTLRQLWRKWALSQIKSYSYEQVVGQYEAVYIRALAEHKSKKAEYAYAKS